MKQILRTQELDLVLPITTRLTGVSFGDGDAQNNIRQWGCADIGTYALVREPENAHDPNAIRVALFGHFFMGYVPRHLSCVLAPMMDAGRRFIAEFISVNRHPYHDVVGLTIRIVEMAPAQ